MIPIRDISPRLRLPGVTYLLLLGISLGFLLQVAGVWPNAMESYGFVPAEFEGWPDKAQTLGLKAVASLFIHLGWIHIIGNLIYLRVFGDNVEARLGHLGFALFFVASAVAGFAAQTAAEPASTVPVVGASGAIAGVLGAYLILFPKAKVVTLFPVFVFLTFIEVPAVFFVGVWAAQQLLNGYLALTEVTDVAWFAHLGGFAFGLVVGAVLRVVRAIRNRGATSRTVRPDPDGPERSA